MHILHLLVIKSEGLLSVVEFATVIVVDSRKSRSRLDNSSWPVLGRGVVADDSTCVLKESGVD